MAADLLKKSKEYDEEFLTIKNGIYDPSMIPYPRDTTELVKNCS
jgi:hypothetical protein